MTITGKKHVECRLLNGNGAAEADDSSYDSDYEDSEARHSDVSRTTSDTLAAEFAEYVTLSSGGAVTPLGNNPGYTARVEFALKLGYTERLVQAALQKLGPEPAQNELLAELIKLGANNSSRLAEDAADFALENEAHLNCLLRREDGGSSSQLRPVVVDGSNVAMSHGNKEVFSCRGIKICVDWFRARGHREITVFVPKWRKEASRPDNPIVDQEILGELERDRLLVFTPSRLVGGKRMVCYDDRYILRLAAELDGVVVSNDNYRDLAQESPEFRRVVEERILMYSFVNDRFMPPDDPLGRSGPTLDSFLGQKRAQNVLACPYAKKCTYGNKCKYRHPERGPHPHKSVTERLVEHAQRHLQARGPSLSVPLNATSASRQHASLGKTKSWAASGGHSPSASSSCETTPKSRSVENVADVVDSSALLASASCARAMVTANQNLQAYPTPHGWMAQPSPEPEPVNMHRKLQRQLSLNPSCDPRLSQFRRYHEQHQQLSPSSTSSTRSSQAIASSTHLMMQNRQLTRHASNDASYPVSISWNQQQRRQQHHQHVTRIASAPDSYRAWPPRVGNKSPISNTNSLSHPAIMTTQRLGASDPQINLLATQPSGYHMPNWATHQQQQDARRHLHYHLANVFPEEQVQAAMALHPHETDPQKICAAILAIFPKV